MDELSDTVLAVSTPWGSSPRAIIRMSGPNALSCAMKIFAEEEPFHTGIPGTYHSLRGRIELEDRTAAPAVLYIMKAPRSYTREDVVEIHTFGSIPLVEMLTEKLLRDARSAGRELRLAEPGEFTKRAFMNGRIDIVQAEAVLQIIRSRTDAELKLAAVQLGGAFSQGLRRTHERIANQLSLLEASIDFSDQQDDIDVHLISARDTLDELEAVREILLEQIRRPDNGQFHRGGVRTVFFGPPNAGKSSLFNMLLGWPRAITSHKSGTTRDALEAELIVDGITFRLLDTAGLGRIETPGNNKPALETLTTDMTTRTIGTSSLFVCVLDGSRPLEKSYAEFPQQLPLHQRPNGANCLLVINKTDLPPKFSVEDLPLPWQDFTIVCTSAVTGSGIDVLKKKMAGKITGGGIDCSASPAVLNARQRILVEKCIESLEQASRSVKEGAPAELVALDVREASDHLGELLGKITTEDILEKIFSQFCIGK